MKAEVIKGDAVVEFETDERCFIREISNSSNDQDVSIAVARVEPGVTTAWHSLNDTDERFLLLSGRGRVEVGDIEPRDVCAGDVVLIPRNVRQRITNIGDEDLVFYAICSPRFEQSNYLDLESTATGHTPNT